MCTPCLHTVLLLCCLSKRALIYINALHVLYAFAVMFCSLLTGLLRFALLCFTVLLALHCLALRRLTGLAGLNKGIYCAALPCAAFLCFALVWFDFLCCAGLCSDCGCCDLLCSGFTPMRCFGVRPQGSRETLTPCVYMCIHVYTYTFVYTCMHVCRCAYASQRTRSKHATLLYEPNRVAKAQRTYRACI